VDGGAVDASAGNARSPAISAAGAISAAAAADYGPGTSSDCTFYAKWGAASQAVNSFGCAD